MLPSKGYFKGVKCPDQSKGGCQRPYCHFRHETRPETDSTAETSSAFVNENTEFVSTTNSNRKTKDVDEESASIACSSSSDMKSDSSAVESISSNVAVSSLNKQASTMAIQPEMIQQLVNAAVQKVIAENPALAAGTVDTAAIMQSIDTSAIVAQATQSMAAKVITSPEQTANREMIDTINTDQTLKTKKKLYLRPPNAPAYNPTPIKELEKRKHVVDEKGSYSPTLTPIRSRLLDDVIESESNSKGSGVESELTDFSASSEDEEDKEKRRSEFDLLEEVLAEHSANNKNKVKKKKKKALGKLQYSNSPTKFIDESSLISDARDVCENDFSIDIDKTPKKKSKQMIKDTTDESDPAPYFLPPSPVFTGASCDGYSNSGTIYTDPYSSTSTSVTNFFKSYDKEENTDSEDEVNEPASQNKKGNNGSTVISNDVLPISVQSKEKDIPRQGHALLCQLVQNPIPVTRLSRQNVSAWLPGAKKNLSVEETNSASGDILETMISNFDGGISQKPASSTDKKVIDQFSKKDNVMPSKLAEAISFKKVDLNKEIQSLNKQKELKILSEEENELLIDDSECQSNDKADKVQDTENENTTTGDSFKENNCQQLIVESNDKKHKDGCDDYLGSQSERENNENKAGDIRNKSNKNKNKIEKQKKSQDKKNKYRSCSESELDEESDESSGKRKKKYKKKKKRSRNKSDSEEESSDHECSDKNLDNDSTSKHSEINVNEKKITSSKSECKENKFKDSNTEDNAINQDCKEHSGSDSDIENHKNKKSDKNIRSGKEKNKKEKHKKSQNKKKKHRSRSDSENNEESDASTGKGKKKHKKKKKRRSRKKSDSEEENSDEESSDDDEEKKGRKQKTRRGYSTEESEANTDKENTDKTCKSKSVEMNKEKKVKEKDDKINADEDQEKKGKERKKRKNFKTDESEANTDKENTDRKCKSKSVERKKEKDERAKEKNDKSHSDSEKDYDKDKLDKSRDKKSEDRHTDKKKDKTNDRLDKTEKRDKDKAIEKENKKRKRSSSSERSSSRHRSSSRKRKKKRRGNKHKKKRGRKHKKRKYSRSDSEESDDDISDEESDEESESSEEKENKSKEKDKRHKSSKHHKRSLKNKKKGGRYKRNRSRTSSESRSRSSRSKSRSKSRDKKRRESQTKEEKKKPADISIPMPVDPSKIKEEKIDCIDLTKVKIEKLDDETMNLDIDIKKTNTGRKQLPCTKAIKEEKGSDNEGEKEITGKQDKRISQKSIDTKSTTKENNKRSETKPSDEVDPEISKRLLDKEDNCNSAKERRKSVDARRDSGDRSKEKNKDKENSYSKSKNNDRVESNKCVDTLVKESERSSTLNKQKVDLDKEIEKLSGKSSMPENQSADNVKSNKSSNETEASGPPAMSIFDMVLASTAVTPTKKALKEVSMFDTVATSNNDFPSPASSPEHLPGNTPVHSPSHSPGHLPDSPSFDYNSKFTDPPGTFSFDGIKRRKSSSDEKDTSKETRKEKDNLKLKDKKEGNHKEERYKESKKSKNEHSKDKNSIEKEKESKSKDDHHKGHRISSSSNSHRSSKEESKHSSSKSSSSSSKPKQSSHSNSSKSSSSSSHTKKKEDFKSHSSNSKHKSDKESDGKSSKHSSSRSSHHISSSSSLHTSTSSSHSSKKQSSSSSSKSSNSSSKKTTSSSSSSSKRKEMLFDDLLNQPNKKLKTEKVKSQSKNIDSDDGGDSPMPDLSALDDIADDDWNQIINADKPQTYDDYSHLANLKSDESDEDELADLDDPRVMEECKQMFDEYEPPLEETIRHSKTKERKVPQERLKVEIPAGKQRIARAPSSGSSTGNLIQRPVHKKPKMTPTQMMMERYKKLKEKAEELNKLVKTQEAQLKKQQVKNEPTDFPTKVDAKHNGLSSAISNKPSGKPRIAHVPNVTGLLQARDQIKSLPPSNSRSLLSAQASKASGSVPVHTTAMTSAKGSKRVAHTPALESLSRPIVPVEYGSKVPQNVRQRYLNTFIDECLKFCEGQAEAFSKSMAEEKVCFNRATSRSIYLNLAVNTIKRLRMKQISEDAQELLLNDPQYSQDNFENQPSTSSGRSSKSLLSHPPSKKPSPMSHPTNPNLRSQSHFTTIATGGTKGSWSIEKVRRSNSEVEKLKGLPLFKHLKSYILSEEDLESNSYPRPDPDEKGKAVIKVAAHRKKISPSSTERFCDRCKISFAVDKWGFPTSTEPCRHHWGRIYKKRGPGGLQSVYSCCSGDLSADGCNIASTHVSQNFNPKELRGYVRTLPKSSKDGYFGIYALDCEMCYTTNGNELTRVTIIDAENNMVYDTLVKPDNPIIDYNTRFSGITEEDMENVTTTIREVQTSCLTRFNDRTILIGHSLESDLHALKIIHDTVIDTSVVFPHKMGPPFKRALRNLSSELLKRIIQEDVSGHDSKEDAAAAMDLMHWKVKEDLKMIK